VSHPDPWAHNRVFQILSACACVHLDTHTTTYIPTRVKNREDTDNTPISPPVKNNPLRQATSALIDWLNHPTFVPQRWMNKLHINERINTPCSERVRKCVRWCHNTCSVYTPTHAWRSLAKLLSKCIHIIRKNAHAPVHAFICNGAETSLSWKLLRTYFKSLRASCKMSFAARPSAVLTKSVARRCSLKMTMIAFIILNRGWNPLIEGLCVQILYFKFEIICGLLQKSV